MIDQTDIVIGLIALIGFFGGVIASIWLGPIAMLYGTLGLPVVLIGLTIIANIFRNLTD